MRPDRSFRHHPEASLLPTSSPAASLPFLARGGEVGRLLRARDWTRSPLGDPADWPPSLRTALSICLHSRVVSAVYWGPDHVVLYNDAYAPALTDRHPWALGRPLREVWPELADVLLPQLAEVLATGEGFQTEDQKLVLQRHGQPVDTFWSYNFAPIHGETGAVAGIFVTATDTTARVRLQEEQARLLAEQEALLRAKEALVRRAATVAQELSHRMINSFQVIETLFRFQTDALDRADPARPVIETARMRVHAMALVHRQIYRTDHGTGAQEIDLGAYLRGLVAVLGEAFGRAQLTLAAEAPDGVPLDAGQAATVGLLATELVINACKYAFPAGRAGRVGVRLAEAGEGYRLVVEDDGVGLPAGFDAAASSGLGMRLVESFVQSLAGTLTVERLHPGSRFTIGFPKP